MLHFTLDTYLILQCVKQVGIKYHFKVFGMTRAGNEPRFPPDHWRTLRCSSYWKRSLLVALDYGRQLYFTYFVYKEMVDPRTLSSFISSFLFLFSLNKPLSPRIPSFSLNLIELYLVKSLILLVPPSFKFTFKTKWTPTTITQTSLFFPYLFHVFRSFPFLFFPYLSLVFRSFPSLFLLYISLDSFPPFIHFYILH